MAETPSHNAPEGQEAALTLADVIQRIDRLEAGLLTHLNALATMCDESRQASVKAQQAAQAAAAHGQDARQSGMAAVEESRQTRIDVQNLVNSLLSQAYQAIASHGQSVAVPAAPAAQLVPTTDVDESPAVDLVTLAAQYATAQGIQGAAGFKPSDHAGLIRFLAGVCTVKESTIRRNLDGNASGGHPSPNFAPLREYLAQRGMAKEDVAALAKHTAVLSLLASETEYNGYVVPWYARIMAEKAPGAVALVAARQAAMQVAEADAAREGAE